MRESNEQMRMIQQAMLIKNLGPQASFLPCGANPKFSMTDAKFEAKTVENLARAIFNFPAKTWPKAVELDHLMQVSSELTDEEANKGALLVSYTVTLMLWCY